MRVSAWTIRKAMWWKKNVYYIYNYFTVIYLYNSQLVKLIYRLYILYHLKIWGKKNKPKNPKKTKTIMLKNNKTVKMVILWKNITIKNSCWLLKTVLLDVFVETMIRNILDDWNNMRLINDRILYILCYMDYQRSSWVHCIVGFGTQCNAFCCILHYFHAFLQKSYVTEVQ